MKYVPLSFLLVMITFSATVFASSSCLTAGLHALAHVRVSSWLDEMQGREDRTRQRVARATSQSPRAIRRALSDWTLMIDTMDRLRQTRKEVALGWDYE